MINQKTCQMYTHVNTLMCLYNNIFLFFYKKISFSLWSELNNSQYEDSQDDNGDEGQTDAAKPEV